MGADADGLQGRREVRKERSLQLDKQEGISMQMCSAITAVMGEAVGDSK